MSDDAIDFPRLLKNGITDWEPLSWNLDKWKLELNRESLEIRTGKLNPAFNYPQWETTTKVCCVPSGDFFSTKYQNSMVEKGEWGYFDYKYMRDLFSPSTLALFSWNSLGLKDRDGMDSTLWIGSQGAHTPCHQDSYGYNLVCQLVGTKKWILFPPNQTQYLTPSRVPYEESSVYSEINFHQIQRNPVHVLNQLQYTTPYIVTLGPGDVLYVPRQWWHFVQNISFSVSVNTWVECKEDNQSRLEESLVRIQAALLSQSLSRDEQKLFLNPNELDLVTTSLKDLTDLSVGLMETVDKNQDQENVYPDFNKHWEPLRHEQSIRWLVGDLSADGGDSGKIKLHIESKCELAKAEEIIKHASEICLPSSERYLPASLVTRVHLFNVLTSATVIKTACEELKKTQL